MGNILLLSQVIAFLVSFLGSFFIFIPVSINLQEFDGHCLLGAKGTWNFSSGNVMLMDIKWGLHSDCGFSIFIGIVAMILSVFFIVWQSVNLFKNTDRYIQIYYQHINCERNNLHIHEMHSRVMSSCQQFNLQKSFS